MSRTSRSSRRQGSGMSEIWPGFVDALAALLVVVIFVLMVFMVSQFYLSNMLSGRDQLVGELSDQINELADLLDLSREESEDARANNARLTAELRNTLTERDTLIADVEQRITEVERLNDALGAANDQVAELRLDRADLEASLSDAFETIEADRETLELRLSELASLQTDIGALRAAREQLEIDVASAALARQVLEEDLARLETALGRSEEDRASLQANLETNQQTIEANAEELRRRAAALALVRSQLEQSQGQVTEQTETLEQTEEQLAASRRLLAERDQNVTDLMNNLEQSQASLAERSDTIAELEETTQTLLADLLLSREDRARVMEQLGAVRDRSLALESDLSDAEERTVLAQREIDERDIRIEELMLAMDQTEASLDEQVELSAEARGLVARLTGEVDDLNQRLAQVQAALDASEASVGEREVEIADLNARLNQALVRRVEELARYRSEFFGRLREVLGQRSDVRVVGDRFVFQSEVLFATGSATLAFEGRRQLAQLAETLLQVITDLPPDIDWILRVDGHTDIRPINSSEFSSNWELSSARAIEVVEFLITQGLPAGRLAAAGFGEYQPLDEGRNEDAFRRNRRIELKFDQR